MDPKYRSLGTSPLFGRIINLIFLMQYYRSGAFAVESPLTCLHLICSQGAHLRTEEEDASCDPRVCIHFLFPAWTDWSLCSVVDKSIHLVWLQEPYNQPGNTLLGGKCHQIRLTWLALRCSSKWKFRYLIFNCQRQWEKYLPWGNCMDLLGIAQKGEAKALSDGDCIPGTRTSV